MRSPRAVLLDALAAQRDGVVSTALVVHAGFDPELPAREVAAGRWLKLLPAIFLTEPGPATPRQRAYAAVLHAGAGCFITGNAGCLLRRLSCADADDVTVHVLVPRAVNRSNSEFCQLTRTSVRQKGSDLVPDGQRPLPVADPARCVADAIRRSRDLARGRAIASAALRDRRVDWSSVAEAATRPGRGAGHLRRVARDIADGVRSPAEGDLHDVLGPAVRGGQLPPYLLNPDVLLNGRLLGSPDAWFVGLGLGDEMDSRQWHEDTEALDATLLRHDRFTDVGLTLNHTTPKRFQRSPQAHVEKLARLVMQRRQLAVPEPAGLVVLGRGPLLPARTHWPQTSRRP